mgnify:CR=1 FL=1
MDTQAGGLTGHIGLIYGLGIPVGVDASGVGHSFYFVSETSLAYSWRARSAINPVARVGDSDHSLSMRWVKLGVSGESWSLYTS